MTEFEDVKLDEDPKPRSSRLNIFHRFDKPAAGASNGVQGTHHRAESGMTRLFGGGRKHEIAPVPESELKSIGGMESSKATPVSVE